MAYEVKWESHGVTWKFSGNVDSQEIIQAGAALLEDPRFLTIKYRLCDFSEIESMDISSDDALLIASFDKESSKLNPDIKIPVVATLRMMKRMSWFYVIGLQNSSWDARLFDNIDEAREWLAGC